MLMGLVGLLVLLAAWIGAGFVMVAAAGQPPPRGTLVDIGGRKMRLVCEGPRSELPLVWLEHGAFGSASDFAAIQQKLAAKGIRSCAHDRAGLGFSDPGPEPRDVAHANADLEKLMAAAGETGPLVLVGHSMAGLYLHEFAGRQSDRIAGLVLVEAATPALTQHPRAQQFIQGFTRTARAVAVANSLGLARPLYSRGDRIGLPEPARSEKRRFFVSGRHARAAAAEIVNWRRSAEQAGAAGPLNPALPVAVVVAGTADEARNDLRRAPARQSQAGWFEAVPDASHNSILGLRHGDAVVRGVEHVLKARGAPAA